MTRQFTPAVGGLENVVHNLAKAQLKAGQRVKVITLNRDFAKPNIVLPEHEDIDGIEVVRVPYRGSHRYPIAPKVLRHIKGADVVHVHAIDFFFDFLALTAPWHRQPLVVTPHGAFFHTRFAARLKIIYFHTVTRVLLRAYRAVINVSRHDHELFQRVRSKGAVWWNNGVNVEKFLAAGAHVPSKRIIAVNRFSSNKRLDRLIAFIAALRQRDPAWELVIAGSEAELSAADIRRLAEQAGMGHAVDLIVRPNDEQIRQAMSGCSVFASASEYEAFGIAAIEGLSAGLMPLLSDIGSFSDIVERTKVGVIANFDHMSPSTVTEHVHALEARLGVRLLNRSTRKISLTEVGGAYYERSKQILADTRRCRPHRACAALVASRAAKVRSFIDLLIRYFREHPTWAQPCKAQEIDRPPQLPAEQVIDTARRCATSRIAFSQAGS